MDKNQPPQDIDSPTSPLATSDHQLGLEMYAESESAGGGDGNGGGDPDPSHGMMQLSVEGANDTDIVSTTTAQRDNSPDATAATAEVDKEKEIQDRAVAKRKYLLDELIETETKYVFDLGTIVYGYIPILEAAAAGASTATVNNTDDDPSSTTAAAASSSLTSGLPALEQLASSDSDFPAKSKIIFGNIRQIYEWHKETFAPELEKSLEDLDKLPLAFIRYEKRLTMYVKYCENKPKSEYIVAESIDENVFEEIRIKLGHKLTLPDLLIKPVQRIMKYQLLLKDICKQTEKAGEDTKLLKNSLEVMKRVPKQANDMMNVGRLTGFQGKITAQGTLLMHESFQVGECSSDDYKSCSRYRQRRIFLFEQSVIMAEVIEYKRGTISSASYIFKNIINVNRMEIIESVVSAGTVTGSGSSGGGLGGDDAYLIFSLQDKSPSAEVKKFLVKCTDEEQKLKWTTEIRSLLDMQRNFLAALQSPIQSQNKINQSADQFSGPAGGGGSSSHVQANKAASTFSAPPTKGGSNKKQKHKHAKTAPVISGSSSSHNKGSVAGAADSPSASTSSAAVPSSAGSSTCNNNNCNAASANLPGRTASCASDIHTVPPPPTKPKKTSLFEGFMSSLRGGGSKSKNSSAMSTSMTSSSSSAATSAHQCTPAAGGQSPHPTTADSSHNSSSSASRDRNDGYGTNRDCQSDANSSSSQMNSSSDATGTAINSY